MTTPRIYIADLAAYNNGNGRQNRDDQKSSRKSGRTHGVWVDATDDLDDIQDAVNALLKASPEQGAEEIAIHDHEGFGGYEVSEHSGLDELHNVAVFIEEHGQLGAKVLDHACDDIDEARRILEEQYSGEYESVADYAEQLTEGTSDIPEHLKYYIDYDRMGRDMELSGDIFTIETGYQEVHIFWNY